MHAATQALGLGIRGRAAVAATSCARRRGSSPTGSASASPSPSSRCRCRRCRCRAAPAAARRARRRSARPTTTSARCTPTAAPTATSSARSAAGSTTRRTSSRTRATRPRSQAVLEWALSAGAAVIPFGGGTSVVGGVEPAVGERLRRRRDDRPQGARPRARGRPGLAVGADPGGRDRARASRQQLAEHGLTLRHFPQSFQFSTLGGWIATRAGGHFATLYTHIDDLVESVRALTPVGVVGVAAAAGIGRRRLARPDADRLRGNARGDHRGVGPGPPAPDAPRLGRRCGSRDFAAGAEAVRALSQSGLYPVELPADRRRARRAMTGAGDGSHALLVLGFESADHDVEHVDDARARVLRRPRRRVGAARRRGRAATARSAAGARRSCARPTCATRSSRSACCRRRSRPRSPGTASRPSTSAVLDARPRPPCTRSAAAGSVTCRFTHVYPDGPAPYYTILAPARRGAELEQWAEIKRAAADAVIAARRHDHPPPRRRPRPPAVVRPPAARAVRGGAARRQGGGRPGAARSTRGC